METPEDSLVIYNDDQKWYVDIKDNAESSIKQFENSIRLQKDIIELCTNKIEALA